MKRLFIISGVTGMTGSELAQIGRASGRERVCQYV